MNPPGTAEPQGSGATPALGQIRACDPHRLARGQNEWQGSMAVASLERFASALVDTAHTVHWRASFSEDRLDDGSFGPSMSLSYSASVQVACGLCAEPVGLVIDETRRFTFASSEAEASQLDEQSLEHDVLVADPRFDLIELIEDELILAVPVLAQHEVCPSVGADVSVGADAVADTQRPFADLASQLKAVSRAKPGSNDGADQEDSASGASGKG